MPVTTPYFPNASTGNGVTTVFPYSFPVIDQSHILVTIDGVEKTLGADYTVSGVGNPSGGNVTFTVAPANGTNVVRARLVPYLRATDYQANGSFREETVDDDIDLLEMQIQQIESRALTLHASAGISGLIPNTSTIAGRAGKGIGFDSAGNVALYSVATVDQVIGNKLFVGPVLTNSYMTYGLNLAQDTASDFIFCAEASNINHGMTDLAKTTMFLGLKRAAALVGGAHFQAFSGHFWAMILQGCAFGNTTDKTTLADAPLRLVASLKNGTGIGGFSGSDNLAVIRDNLTTRYIFDAGARMFLLGASSTDILGNGNLFINETANGNMAKGITIRQLTADANNQILDFRSEDVTTGLSSVTEQAVHTEDWYNITRRGSARGGARVQVLGEDAVALPTVYEVDVYGGQAATADTTSTEGLYNVFIAEHDGANALRNAAVNQSAYTIRTWSGGAKVTRLLLKGDDGELHLGNTTLVALDDEDDVLLARAMQKVTTQGGIRESELDNPFYDYQKLRDAGLVGPADERGNFLFPLQPRLAVHEGAIWQLFLRLVAAESKLQRLTA